MKLIISSDRQKIVNCEQVHSFVAWDAESGEGYVYADDELLSTHTNLESAKKELACLMGVMSCGDSFLYQSVNR